jgi:hypothetical protein
MMRHPPVRKTSWAGDVSEERQTPPVIHTQAGAQAMGIVLDVLANLDGHPAFSKTAGLYET